MKCYTCNVAEIPGFGGEGVMPQLLGPIMWFCEDNNCHPLAILVVNQETGLPDKVLLTIEEVNTDREKVFNFDWLSIMRPQNITFEDADRNKDKS